MLIEKKKLEEKRLEEERAARAARLADSDDQDEVLQEENFKQEEQSKPKLITLGS